MCPAFIPNRNRGGIRSQFFFLLLERGRRGGLAEVKSHGEAWRRKKKEETVVYGLLQWLGVSVVDGVFFFFVCLE